VLCALRREREYEDEIEQREEAEPDADRTV